MLKKILLILLINANPYILNAESNCNCHLNINSLTFTESIIAISVLGAGTVIAAPLILPASVIASLTAATAATKVAACTAWAITSPYIVPTTTVAKVSLGLSVAQGVRPYIIKTAEENLNTLKEKRLRRSTARQDFVMCLQQNKFGSEKNTAGRPSACENLARAYAMTMGQVALEERTKAFRDGKCFCYGDK